MTDSPSSPETLRELRDVAQKIASAVHPIIGPVRRKILAAIVLVEVVDEVDIAPPVGSWGAPSSLVALGAQCVVGTVPGPWIPTVLRHIADHEDSNDPEAWGKVMRPKPVDGA